MRCNVAVLTTAALMKAHSTGTSPLTICFCRSLQHGTNTSVFLLIRSMLSACLRVLVKHEPAVFDVPKQQNGQGCVSVAVHL